MQAVNALWRVCSLRPKLHYTNTGYEHQQQTPPSTNGQVVMYGQHVRSRLNLLYNILPATDTNNGDNQRTSSQQFYNLLYNTSHHQRTKICHIPTSWHVEMLGSGIAMCKFVVELLWARPLVVSVAGVRVVEFGPNLSWHSPVLRSVCVSRRVSSNWAARIACLRADDVGDRTTTRSSATA